MKLRPLLLAAAAALVAANASAADFSFGGSFDAGPLAGQSFAGSYSLNISALTGAGFESLALSAFSLTLPADSYSLATGPGATADYSDGVFLGLSYQSSRLDHTLVMASGSMDASDAFVFYRPLTGLESSGGYTVAAAPIPEPQTWALLVGGLAAIGALARRRRA